MTMDEAVDFLGCSKRTLYRYVKDGRLSYTEKNGGKWFKRKDLAPILTNIIDNKEKHRPDTSDEPSKSKKKELIADTDLLQRILKATKPKPILNGTGKEVLMATTKYLKDIGFIDNTTKEPILRYSIAVQMKEVYLELATEFQVKFYFDLVKQFQSEIQHYEKELGLTPAALAKIKPMEKEDVDVDPMEALLNG